MYKEIQNLEYTAVTLFHGIYGGILNECQDDHAV
jgi:hypothetical protein